MHGTLNIKYLTHIISIFVTKTLEPYITGRNANSNKFFGSLLYYLKCVTFNEHVWWRGEVGKPEGKELLGRPRRRWEDNIKMDLQEVGWGAWTGSIRLRTATDSGHL